MRQRMDVSQREMLQLKPTMKKITTAKKSVNFGQGTLSWQPILWHETAKS